ncbi:endonuclease/exonuclease/phosphatase family protein [Novosphingobium sp. JCM 18896]|uniref:endonuclease/exonuclease/phosphatase family protein n=1 Tax=Novosphingobium sp. JCM 18896 TaxID=2989731 RepID=UPI0022231E5C|nr:endonuclease/exonuclease/phosphatase family protein [Novosphingobium sp. JCM 18896]MCW1429132.1 endonuclease/exonuclease/phosphatase family protein [Novosphingobium sp. JCM 18896]
MELTFASYNIHKAVGIDRRRDPDRIIAILNEIGADVVALQEADRRFGRRETVLPLAAIDTYTPYRAIPLQMKPDSIGWHGNALLVRREIEVIEAAAVPLPTLEPRGAVRADLRLDGHRLRVVGMHLDLSGLRRRQQVRSILSHVAACDGASPTVLMGDFNEWARHGGCFHEFLDGWHLLAPGRSFPSRRPVAQLDRIVASHDWKLVGTGVHHSALAAKGSDHLPVWARLSLPKN